MSTDENRPLPSSSRPVERAALPPGPARELRDAIYRCYAEAGCPRLEALADAVAADDRLPGAPRKDLISKIISGEALATKQDCVSVAVALAYEAGRKDVATLADRIRDLWVEAQTAPVVSLGRLIGACDPIALEVHRAIDVPHGGHKLSPLPAYVDRTHDRRMREIADQALTGSSRLITVVGRSSTGKTRACWELAQYVERRQPGRWRLWHPFDPTRPEAAAGRIDLVGPHTIVWLNEAQLYLAPLTQSLGERIAAGLRNLLSDRERGPVLVLATMWPGHWTTLTTRPMDDGLADPHAQARELLSATDVDVPDAFTGADLTDLDAHGDPRLHHAGKHATGGRITQYLAGAPLLLDRYRKAPPAARAVLDVAVDGRRLGHLPVIPRTLLERAAAGYLDDDEWHLDGADWLEQALAYTGRPCNGTSGLLTPVRPRPGEPAPPSNPAYRLADYLEQTGATLRAAVYPPSSFWHAACSTIRDGNSLRVLGWAAEQRGRYRHAAALYRASLEIGDLGSFRALLRLIDQIGGPEEDIAELCQQVAGLGSTDALIHLAFRRERTGDRNGAAELYRRAVDLGDTDAMRALNRLADPAGERDRTARLRQAVAESVTTARMTMTERGERAGDLDRISMTRSQAIAPADDLDRGARQLRRAAERADTYAFVGQAQRCRRAGDLEDAVAAARQAADRGQTGTLSSLALQLERHGDRDGAVRLAREAADFGNPVVLSNLARRRQLDGDLDSAASLYREAVDRANINAVVNLARLHEHAGDRDGAERIRRFGLDAAGAPAEPWSLRE